MDDTRTKSHDSSLDWGWGRSPRPPQGVLPTSAESWPKRLLGAHDQYKEGPIPGTRRCGCWFSKYPVFSKAGEEHRRPEELGRGSPGRVVVEGGPWTPSWGLVNTVEAAQRALVHDRGRRPMVLPSVMI